MAVVDIHGVLCHGMMFKLNQHSHLHVPEESIDSSIDSMAAENLKIRSSHQQLRRVQNKPACHDRRGWARTWFQVTRLGHRVATCCNIIIQFPCNMSNHVMQPMLQQEWSFLKNSNRFISDSAVCSERTLFCVSRPGLNGATQSRLTCAGAVPLPRKC